MMMAFTQVPNYPQLMRFTINGRKPHPKSKFTPQEDEKLRSIVNEIGENDWPSVSKRMGTRNQRQCKERWFNYLSPNVKALPWTPEDDFKLENLHNEFGAKWVKIAQFFPSRTDTNIKSRWMVLQRQKRRMENKADTNSSVNKTSNNSTNTSPCSETSSPESNAFSTPFPNIVSNFSSATTYQNSTQVIPQINQIPTKESSINIKQTENFISDKAPDCEDPFQDSSFFEMNFAPMDVITDECYDFFDWN
ncbi:Myb-like DNA-binding domain containing protein [Tritrichomonas foetus]|uniref:Myb-like DNA-binding domain containing protein n=1 Tax=Tritrichomonas foetus TaxID=1144522 RepID=A0A1J4JKJ0_9EUKA|nr:Myb-like DNA-binding domain containing protein [Tritrichomonas foetus]|eukprot:OHS99153.1 Myb-like DNA-binding domain containing protein [Tritrichomonas foetus]